jgi:hypothetical protein
VNIIVNYTIKTTKGKRYVYKQDSIEGKQRETYIGSYNKPEVRALIEPKITPKITNLPQENLGIYKKQVLADIRELKALSQFGSMDKIREKISQLENKPVKDLQFI